MILLAGEQHTKVEEVVDEARGHPEVAASGLACSLSIARMFNRLTQLCRTDPNFVEQGNPENV